ncbi:MAG: hypothetical protein PHR51_02590 [Patescibacteria group bacterium]|nr:hypothetical protein [Patescibacteria group bacterium]
MEKMNTVEKIGAVIGIALLLVVIFSSQTPWDVHGSLAATDNLDEDVYVDVEASDVVSKLVEGEAFQQAFVEYAKEAGWDEKFAEVLQSESDAVFLQGVVKAAAQRSDIGVASVADVIQELDSQEVSVRADATMSPTTSTNLFIKLWTGLRGFFARLFGLAAADAMVAPGDNEKDGGLNLIRQLKALLADIETAQADCPCKILMPATSPIPLVSDPSQGQPQIWLWPLVQECDCKIPVYCQPGANEQLAECLRQKKANEPKLCAGKCYSIYPPCLGPAVGGLWTGVITDPGCYESAKRACFEAQRDCLGQTDSYFRGEFKLVN